MSTDMNKTGRIQTWSEGGQQRVDSDEVVHVSSCRAGVQSFRRHVFGGVWREEEASIRKFIRESPVGVSCRVLPAPSGLEVVGLCHEAVHVRISRTFECRPSKPRFLRHRFPGGYMAWSRHLPCDGPAT